ncbi:MAG: NGG1p interacting factor NIF3 [Bdellovibrionales bacterium CG12_big_fil_rev_8_21_14_0_65_38_15]|nr:MAG: NGG1p interacting factor NIF3 [Bdellovibrionales bacterium CG22_combo_CG10-13_8_21_14_all_38_13]PIQ56949.1 MAG: NGG1p interacting factor NIF3 [Bdellovibrionales bacterium CG12_big_fil_rev_8_21_14_0_65_38_15]PIR29090.1 MAG: NGG1p interacting factor NIF3 [Bdellovibrionales bacterium CG11_big_fil_rev_8_21_14_0_20_38_13]
MHKLTVYIPLKYKEVVKSAMFKMGAGKVGNYDQCSFEVIGTGQFRPLKGSEPFIGSTDNLQKVEEARVEMIVEDSMIKDVVAAMKSAHPYETPAYDIVKMVNL